VTVVAGYKAEAIDVEGIRIARNPSFATSGELVSLGCALDSLGSDTVLLYGDLLFRGYVLQDLLNARGELAVVVDSAALPERGNLNDLAYCSAPDDRAVYRQEVRLERVCREPRWNGRTPEGRWIGMARIRGEGREWLRESFERLRRRADFSRLGVPDLLNELIESGRGLGVVYVHGHWLDVNQLDDLERASEFAFGEID
jgi:phosphoenolpyruvate phosphomutase